MYTVQISDYRLTIMTEVDIVIPHTIQMHLVLTENSFAHDTVDYLMMWGSKVCVQTCSLRSH